MKTKMKTILSVCILMVLLFACTKDSVRPEPVYDCMRVENGVAAIDDCGDCHQSYVYDYVSHIPTYIEDTVGLILGATEMLVLAGSVEDIAQNPNWNANCTDCMGVQNGVAVVDSCGDCQGAYIYNMVTHDPSEIIMLGGDTTGASATLTSGQVIILPEDPGNPYWNFGCK